MKSQSKPAAVALHKVRTEQWEKQQEQRTIAGYKRKPVRRGEFFAWHKAQVWVA